MSRLVAAYPLTTMRYDPDEGGFYLLERHNARLQSAAMALFPGLERELDLEEYTEELWKCVRGLGLGVRQRVRVTIDPDLRYHVTATRLLPSTSRPLPLRLDIAPTKVSSLATHKSTARKIYEDARARIGADYDSSGGVDDPPFDVLMWNGRGEVTETSIANFAVYLRGSELSSAVPNWNRAFREGEEGIFVTPSLQKGLIAGVMRAELLEKGVIVEGTITRRDMLRYAKDLACPMICFNAVRGIYKVYLLDDTSAEDPLLRQSHAVDVKSSGFPRSVPLSTLAIPPTPQTRLTTPDTTPGLTPVSSPRPSSSSSFNKDYLDNDTLPSALSPVIKPVSFSPFVWRRGVIIDCYDSYTNNLLQLFDQEHTSLSGSSTNFDANLAAHVTVLRADQISWPHFYSQIFPHLDFIILSPGPGSPHIPADIGVGGDLLLAMNSRQLAIQPVPVLGVCLGHQALAALLGGKVVPARELVHGRTVPVQHNGTGLFEGLNPQQQLRMVRYNSLTVDSSALPSELEVIATNPEDGEIMGLQHTSLPLYSVQFHPESICSRRSNYGVDAGKQILRNFMNLVDKFWVENGRPECLPLPSSIQKLGVLNPAESSKGELNSSLPKLTNSNNYLFRIERRGLGSRIPSFAQDRPDLLFNATSYSSDRPFFWLDSAAAAPGDGFARFSYMGSSSLDQCISYELSTNTVSCGADKRLQLKGDDTFWHWMDRIQRDLAQYVEIEDGSEGFQCGFVGYFGYEMKTGALPGYSALPVDGSTVAHPPDAQFLFADRLLTYDHWNKTWTALGLVRNECGVSARTLIEQEAKVPVGMRGSEFDCWVDSVTQKLSHLQDHGEIAPSSLGTDPLPLHFTYNSTPEAYKSSIEACKSHIADGNSYELCLTGQYTTSASKTPIDYLAVYNHFRVQNPASHAAFVSFPAAQTTIMSCSPELFIRFDGANGRQAVMKPIKGTLKRSKCRCGGLCKLAACGPRKAECDSVRYKQDEPRIRAFVNDPKETAENLMIADLIRANLLEFCSASSVDVTKLFALETYENVYSLVSTITGTLLPSIGTVEGIRRCFPPGSMTGAPKLRSVQLLDAFESSSRRGIYSGCLGFLSLDNRAVFSVVIRTLVGHKDQLSYGAGGAITWLSDVDGEWDEVVLKAQSVLKDRVTKSN